MQVHDQKAFDAAAEEVKQLKAELLASKVFEEKSKVLSQKLAESKRENTVLLQKLKTSEEKNKVLDKKLTIISIRLRTAFGVSDAPLFSEVANKCIELYKGALAREKMATENDLHFRKILGKTLGAKSHSKGDIIDQADELSRQ